MSLSRTVLLTGIAVAAGSLYAALVRGYPWFLALFLGAAIGALVFSIQRTTDRLRAARPRRSDLPDD